MPMTGLDALAATLRAEVQIIEELLELGKAKRQLMADADEIAAIAAKEQEMLPGLEALEKERLVLTDVISGGKSWEEALADLGEDGQEIGALVQRLAENVRRLKEVNDLNQELLRETLHFVQFSLNVLTDDTPVTYDQSGQTSSGKSIFDRKV
ncbi:MAG: flagellar protein FlgN [Firmicutes bacterium]|jgi:flagellar biosynthesis/type III secretory pathway chaperone|nr:flagellar protein FlgN [Bacillota bacterium]